MKIGPQFKIARRLGERVFPKTQSAKFTLAVAVKKKRGRGGMTEYGSQLIEKQKAKYTYGVNEKQFANYIKNVKSGHGNTPASSLFQSLERRLDNVVFRMGLVLSRRFARQIVSHGHIWVNGRRHTVPSYQVKVGDVISIRPQSKDSGIFKHLPETMKSYQAPGWLDLDGAEYRGTVKALPTLGEGESNLNFSSILEFYSRV